MGTPTLAVDIDGTMTEDDTGRIHLGALESIRRAAAAGCNVVFVTGRSSQEAYMLAVYAGTTRIAVGENGGCIARGPASHEMLGNKESCLEGYELLRSRISGILEKPVFPRLTEVVLERTFDLGAAQEILDSDGQGLRLSDSGYACHINSAGVDKGTGLGRALEILGASAEDAVAIGDSATDIPLFEAAGRSIALGNAPDNLRSRATIVAESPYGAGVAESLDEISLEGASLE